MSSANFELVVGLEVHAQLLTASKIFSSDAVSFGDMPNRHTSFITLAHPGTLPRLNMEVVELAIRMGIACNCKIADKISFDRKNYFYPDLPKGYQITQDKNPICKGGFVKISGDRKVTLNRIHLEEDAGKSLHDIYPEFTCIDFNRAGTPLIEIVSEPCLNSSADAAQFVQEIRKLLRFLRVGDGNMEQGSLRADANVSVRRRGEAAFGKKVEIKNMNSIRNLKDAIEYEFNRQSALLLAGNTITSETRLFDAASGETLPMREKEELNDYRYFAEPDLPEYAIDHVFIEQIKNAMPKTSADYVNLFIESYGLPSYQAEVVASDEVSAEFFLKVIPHCNNYLAVANWIIGPVKNLLNQDSVRLIPVQAADLATLINMVDQGVISYTIAVQKVLPLLSSAEKGDPMRIASENGWLILNDEVELLRIIRDIIRIYPLKVEEFKKGKKGILAMFMGEVMKRTNGKADPKQASQLLMDEIRKSK